MPIVVASVWLTGQMLALFSLNHIASLKKYTLQCCHMQIDTTACCVPEVGVHTYNGQQLATAVNWVTKGALAIFNDHLQDPRHILVYI